MLHRHLALLLSLAPCAAAQDFEYLPGARYDPSVPDLKTVVGHDFGERVTAHAEMERYVRALAEASPRVRLVTYGESWEGRELFYLLVGSEENLERADEISRGMQDLADPRNVADERVAELVESLPAVVWLAYSVHGNEISSTDAALLTAYHLAAAQRDEIASVAREKSLVIIDPLQNPDGRDRFVHYFRQTRGRWPDADAQAAEHNEAWPGGRTNHYLFDMNRDWFALTQPESKARVKAFLEWYPLVYVDAHEMGSNSTYYFPPPADPLNPELTPEQMKWLEAFGRNNAQWFDRMGFDYFTREVFDSFYPGYGEGWPMFHGAIGMTFEQASVRGLLVKREDETTLHYRESVQQHFIASLSTVETASRERAGMLQSFVDYRRAAARRGADLEIGEYLLVPGLDPNRVRKLVALLMAQGIEVMEAQSSFVNPEARELSTSEDPAEVEFPDGTYVVSLAQPAGRLVQTLLARQQDMAEDFVAEQKRRRQKRLGAQIYDVTAWSLPLLFDVECYVAKRSSHGSFRILDAPPVRVGRVPEKRAKVAYLIPWGTQSAARALASLLRQDVRVHCAGKKFVLAGADYPAGSLIVKTKDNPEDLYERMLGIAAGTGAEITATDTSWVDEGINFGSNQVRFVKKPKVALAYGRPASAYSVGWTRYLLEHEYGYPVTIVRVRQLARADLSKYDVIILPSGGYDSALASAADALKTWVRAGGTLVTLGNATRWLTGEKVGLLASKREDRPAPKGKGKGKGKGVDKGKDKTEAEAGEEPEPADEEAEPPAEQETEKKPAVEADDDPFDLQSAIQPAKEPPERTPGAILRIVVDDEHWLGFGYDGDANVLVGSSDIYTPIKLDKGRNVGVYEQADRMVLSGFTWVQSAEQLAQKAYLVWQPHGRGHVVAFAEDPNFRAFCDGLNLLFLNAVFFGPAH